MCTLSENDSDLLDSADKFFRLSSMTCKTMEIIAISIDLYLDVSTYPSIYESHLQNK